MQDRDGQRGELRIIRPATMEFRDAAEKAATHWVFEVAPIASEQWRVPKHCTPPPPKSDLMPWSRLWPFLHRCQSRRRSGPKLAVERLVAAAARLAPPTKIPYEPVWQWTRDAWILVDFRDSLFPFHDDILRLLERWRTVFGADACRIIPSHNGRPPQNVPPPETPVLYIGDFGMLANRRGRNDLGDTALAQAWIDYARRLRQRNCRACALLPCPRERWNPAVTSVWTCACWSESVTPPSVDRGWSPREGKPADDRAALDHLSALAAPALRIEMPLLRALRRLLPPQFDDPGVEYDFFHACARDLDAVVLSGEAAMGARPGFRALPLETRRKIVVLLRQHHADCAAIVRARETLVLEACEAPVPADEADEAKVLIRRACAALLKHLQAEDREAIIRAGFANWQQCELESFTESTAEEIAVAWRVVQEMIGQTDTDRPEVIGDQDLLWLEEILKKATSRKTDWQLRRVGNDVRFQSPNADDAEGQGIRSGGHAIRFPARNRRLEIIRTASEGSQTRGVELTSGYRIGHESSEETIVVRTDLAILKCDAVQPPGWASRFGWDRFGLFAEFEVGGVAFGLRWIPPGEFEMGSPDDEPGRWDAEGPRHRVTIGCGFWLATTPVTQAQYAAVTGRRPSRFQHAGDRAPVEQVSWDDCREFCNKLKDEIAKLDQQAKHELVFRLPSEAQWEYACRAGTSTALYTGPLTIVGERNGPELDSIAWYGGNSGVEFEGAEDSSAWREKQQDHRRAGTHPVGTKNPNPWGLYDMLGNVLEWCDDVWHSDYEGAPDNGSAWVDTATEGSGRVIRGGGWASLARFCRCAYRDRWPPGFRFRLLGFRFVLASTFNEDVRAFP
jgi:formylglycine-generating enzyme required for sulfatase activity